ncbi:serine/threonine-protein kinase [Streptomyces sp. NRRL WC-3549]|uniref:serine/threonine-protein kinase n=1 Tax=Streptomyces sp. NRRL WC-3549 TaxID=1463925 RepID=UPI0004C50D46|nr:serine/threonine-protein kinase [Streptomyces sp. NRRL WC-3549]
MQPLEAGEPRAVGGYRLIGRLGAGGMGRVYLGRSAGGRTVAVKVVHPHFALDEQFRARFRREVEAARRVGAQWTAPVLDADPDAPVPWVATGYVAGPPLSDAVTRHGPLPSRAVRALGAGLGEALDAVHAQGLVHRDVKPSNVLLALDGPRLIDFGIARALGATVSLTSTGVSVGSPGYMAPEQIRGLDASGAADVFSLGAVLVYAATGNSPFPGDSSAVLLYKVVHEEPELGDLEGELRELVAGCLAKDPADRPAPAELARCLSPGGAAVLVAPGWLPDPLVREVSRSAVALLDLEPQDEPVGSGPVPFSSASLGGPELGAFGPPPPPPPPGPWPVAGATGQGPGARVAVTLDTGPQPGPRRGRRVSCTVALAVAGALAAVTVGAGLLGDLFPGSGAEHKGDEGAAAPPSAAASKGPASPPGDAEGEPSAELPEAFVGTWRGAVSAAGLPAGEMTVELAGARVGQRVGTAEQVDLLGNFLCEDVLTLRRIDGDTAVVDGRKGARGKGVCTDGVDGLRLVLKDDALEYVSDDADAGNPRGTLTRTTGG